MMPANDDSLTLSTDPVWHAAMVCFALYVGGSVCFLLSLIP